MNTSTDQQASRLVESKIGPLEKVGHYLLKRMGQTCPDGVVTSDARVLSEQEQTQLKHLARWAVLRAGLVGAASAITAAAAAVVAEKQYPEPLGYWLFFGGVSLVAALIEVGFLYWDALRTVHRISSVCDVELFPQGEERSRMAGIMVRAAMELPNPPDRDPYIDPFRQASKVRVLAGVLLYKGKVMLTNALAKVLVRKILARGVARAWLEFIAVPVTAGWNALVCFWVLREARVRAIGPSAVSGALPDLLGDQADNVHAAGQRAVACCVSASRDLHPNHLAMLTWMRQHSSVQVTDGLDDEASFMVEFGKLESSEKSRVLEVLAMAAVIDGRVARRERELLDRMLAQSDLLEEAEQTNTRLRQQAKVFRQGMGVPRFFSPEQG